MVSDTQPAGEEARQGITWRAFFVGLLVTAFFAVVGVLLRHKTINPIDTTITQVPILPYLLVFGAVLMLNPLLKRIRVIRPFTVAELMVVFVMGSVSSGVVGTGFAARLVPLMGGLFSPAWNNAQAGWDVHVQPYLKDRFFVAEPGITEASVRARDARKDWEDVWETFQAANVLLDNRAALDEYRNAWEASRADPVVSSDPVRRAELDRELEELERAATRAERVWKERDCSESPEVVASTWSNRVARIHATLESAQAELDQLEEKAFAQVNLFRRGLPKGMRAAPGIIPIKGETAGVYKARLHRLTEGMTALKELRQAETVLVDGGALIEEHLQKALDTLTNLAQSDLMESERRRIDARFEKARADLAELDEYYALVERRQRTSRDNKILRRTQNTMMMVALHRKTLVKRKNSIERERDIAILPALQMADRVEETRERLALLNARVLASPRPENAVVLQELRDVIDEFAKFDASYRRFFAGDINWHAWLGPIANWGLLIVLVYAMLMTFNVLIFRQWSTNEKLIYPLAQLPCLLGGMDEGESGRVPPLYRSPLFWTGFGISAFVLLWNEYVYGQGVFQLMLPDFKLMVRWDGHVKNTMFEGLTGVGKHHVIFTVIGLAFLIPTRISFSLWAFQVVFFIQLLALVGLGLGINWHSFPFNVTSPIMNFRTAQGGGALLVFGTLLLWKCRRYIACALTRDPMDELDPGERKEMRVASWLFLLSSVGLIMALVFHLGANIYFAVFFYLIMLLITVSMTRAVAEGGLIGFQCAFSPLHFLRSVFGLDRTWTTPGLLAPLAVFYSILFVELRTFISPAMANAMKIRENVGMQRAKFHVAIILAILMAAAIGVAVHIMSAYHGGADTIHYYEYRFMPKHLFSSIKEMATTNPVDTSGSKWWLLGGAAGMALLLYGRRRIFWLPHPIGYIMLVNPFMNSYWFPFLLGWLFKVMVSKYGNKNSYVTARRFFIGLIIGELVTNFFGTASLDRGF